MNKGFLLLDSLVVVFVVSSMCVLCLCLFNLIEAYSDGYCNYQESSNNKLEIILNDTFISEGCYTDE